MTETCCNCGFPNLCWGTNEVRRDYHRPQTSGRKHLGMCRKAKKRSSFTIVDWQGRMLEGEVCLLKDSPFRILRAAESGNVEDFNRLYVADNASLHVRDYKGRTAAHQAAARNKIAILQFIKSRGGDLNVQDDLGNTPLHVAIENNAYEALDFLLKSDVDTSLQNNRQQGPLHLAVKQNNVKALELMSWHAKKLDPHQGGEHGRTPLHLAAMYDFAECAQILMSKFGAKTKQPCNNGYYPIHEAAKNASSRVMEVFLEWGESCGNTREQMISFYDAEGNVPLHSAVHSGDLKAVELCLQSGAKISTKQFDMSTPVHLACSQGALDLVKLMFELQPEEKAQCLTSYDAQKMTPLHCAAMFNRHDIVEYIIQEGTANVNALDKENRSPLLLAASRRAWESVKVLVAMGADIFLKDCNQRNILHLIVIKGGDVEGFLECVCKKNPNWDSLQQLLDEKDGQEFTPMHYACEGGYIKSTDSLLKYGACINLKNANNEAPLHVAAWNGRINILRKLLETDKGMFIINESNGCGLTPLHIASQQGYTSMVQLLLNKGALLHRDHNGRNPLHLAAMAGCVQTMELLNSVHSHLLDQTDKDRNTALHLATMENKPSAISLLLTLNCKLLPNNRDLSAIDYAIYYKYPEAALIMVMHDARGMEVMSLKSDKHPCVALALIASMPKVFEAVQDKSITKANCKKDSKLFYAMVNHGRVELLAHPLSQKYLEMKWNSYGKYFHLAHLLLYTVFLIFVTYFSSNIVNSYPKDNSSSTTISPEFHAASQHRPLMFISACLIFVYVIINVIREFIQLYQRTCHYITDPTNLIYILLYISTVVLVTPTLFHTSNKFQISCASITVFLTWFTLLLNLQRFDHVGIYVVMFLEILQTLIKVLIVFSILIVAFGLAFYILLSRGNHLAFSSVSMSIMRTFAMMLGEIDFLGTYVYPYYNSVEEDDTKTIPFPLTVFCILGIFMVLMPILLMNLLIGLAVGDIESVKRNAKLKRLAMQVLMHSDLERKLPLMLLNKIDKKEIMEYPNEGKSNLGILDFLFRIWFYHALSEDGSSIEKVLERKEEYKTNELEELKVRLNKINGCIDQQKFLLKLITQKMCIKSDCDEVDEGVATDEYFQDKVIYPFLSRFKMRSAQNLL